jgi:hypothetical protein
MHVQMLVSVVKMAIVFEECTLEERRPVLRFLWPEDSMQRIFIKKSFLFRVGNVCHVKLFTTGSRHFLKNLRKSQMISDQIAGR